MSRIIVIAKAPRPGFAKTRLIPALGDAGSAKMAKQLLNHALNQAIDAKIGPVELCFAPDDWHCSQELAELLPQSKQWVEQKQLQFSTQGSGNLGERMARACERSMVLGESVILMGSDCPGLTAEVLRQLDQHVKTKPVCFVPANDGGYVALALSRYDSSIFTNISWSTAQVAEQTRERLRALRWQWLELSPLADIDELEDLQYLPDEWKTEFRISEV